MKLIVDFLNDNMAESRFKELIKNHNPYAKIEDNMYFKIESDTYLDIYDVNKFYSFDKVINEMKEIDFHSDIIQIRSPLYFLVEKIIYWNEHGIPINTALVHDYILKMTKYMIDNYGKDIEILVFLDDSICEKNYDIKYIYNRLLKDSNRKFKLNIINYTNEKDQFDFLRKMHSQCDNVNLKYPYTVVLDIDDVIVNWFGIFTNVLSTCSGDITQEEYKILKDKIPISWPDTDSNTYFIKGNILLNFDYIAQKIYENIKDKDISNFNMVLLTARCELEDSFLLKNLAIVLKEGILPELEKKYNLSINFDINTNILSNVYKYNYFMGATLLKGFSIYKLMEKINTTFDNGGLLYFEDRKKYIVNAINNIEYFNTLKYNSKRKVNYSLEYINDSENPGNFYILKVN